MEKIEETLINDRSLKTIRKRLDIVRHQLFAPKDANGHVITNMEKVVKVQKKFHSNLYSDQIDKEGKGGEGETMDLKVPIVTTNEVKNDLQGKNMGKVEDGLIAVLFKDTGFVINKLSQIYIECLSNKRVLRSCKNTTIILY